MAVGLAALVLASAVCARWLDLHERAVAARALLVVLGDRAGRALPARAAPRPRPVRAGARSCRRLLGPTREERVHVIDEIVRASRVPGRPPHRCPDRARAGDRDCASTPSLACRWTRSSRRICCPACSCRTLRCTTAPSSSRAAAWSPPAASCRCRATRRSAALSARAIGPPSASPRRPTRSRWSSPRRPGRMSLAVGRRIEAVADAERPAGSICRSAGRRC